MTIRFTTRFGMPFVRRGEATPTSEFVDVSEQLATKVEQQLGVAVDNAAAALGALHTYQTNLTYAGIAPSSYTANVAWWQQVGEMVFWGCDIIAATAAAVSSGAVRVGTPQAFGGAPAPDPACTQIGVGVFYSWGHSAPYANALAAILGVGGAVGAGLAQQTAQGSSSQLALIPAAKDRAVFLGQYVAA